MVRVAEECKRLVREGTLTIEIRRSNDIEFRIDEEKFNRRGKAPESWTNPLEVAANAFLRDFDDPVARINRHTDLCVAVRELRETARANRNTPFYWALVDIHDCIHASVPEEMTRNMAEVLRDCVALLSPDMSEENMLQVTDALFEAGLRPWRPRKRTQARRKTASKSRR